MMSLLMTMLVLYGPLNLNNDYRCRHVCSSVSDIKDVSPSISNIKWECEGWRTIPNMSSHRSILLAKSPKAH